MTAIEREDLAARDYARVNEAIRGRLPALAAQWVPGGFMDGVEYVVRNPTRQDRNAGSFRFNTQTGRWSDFATGDSGADAIGYYAYVNGIRRADACAALAGALGVTVSTPRVAPLRLVKTPPKPAAKAAPAKSKGVPIVPVPDDAPPMRWAHPDHGAPTQLWAYHAADGGLMGYVCRFDFTGPDGAPDKTFRPVAYCRFQDGRARWSPSGFPEPLPLLQLPEILERADAPVIVNEGEKAAGAAAALFPEAVATTPMHGAKSPHKTDWTPVADRIVIIAPDYDEPGRTTRDGRPLHPGRDFAEAVAELARTAGAARVLHLEPERLARSGWKDDVRQMWTDDPPDGWDLADALAEGWTGERAAAEIGSLLELPDYSGGESPTEAEAAPAVSNATPEAAALAAGSVDDEGCAVAPPADEAPQNASSSDTTTGDEAASGAPGFRATLRGLEKYWPGKDDEPGEWRWFCSPLEVTAETRNDDGEAWGRLLCLTDRDGRAKEWAMPMEMLAGNGDAYRSHLLSLGLVIGHGGKAREALHEFIATARPSARARCVDRTGWHENAFVLRDEVVTPAGADASERRILQTRDGIGADNRMRVRGGLDRWQAELARYAVGNSRLALALSAAFVAPLLKLAEGVGESGGFHFRGSSSTGKSTALIAAGSVWGGGDGGFIRTWRATTNGLEGVAAAHSDCLLCLDEISQVDAREAGAAAYMLGNGQGKTRAMKSGAARQLATWRTLFLSSGEISLADKMGEDGRQRRASAGQAVRVVDIAADAGAGLGLFEDLHGFSDGGALSRHLKAASEQHYGHAARAFLRAIIDDQAAVADEVKSHVREFVAAACERNVDGQVKRVATRFALAAAAGVIATERGVLPWPAGEAVMAARRCFADWLEGRGGTESAEERDAVSLVRLFLIEHGTSRFAPADNLDDARIRDRVGYLGGTSDQREYIIPPETWKSVVCKGANAEAVAKTLAARGYLVTDGRHLTTKRVRHGRGRFYVVRDTILRELENGEDQTADADERDAA